MPGLPPREERAYAVPAAFAEAGAVLVAFFRRQFPGHREDADDLSQETLLAAWRILRDPAAPPVGDMSAYLLGIARNKARDAVRTRSRERERLRPLRAPAEGGPDLVSSPLAPRLLERRDCARRLLRVLRTCGPRERRLLILRFVAGMPHGEACELVGIDPVRGSRLVYRTLRRLRHCWTAGERARTRRARGAS